MSRSKTLDGLVAGLVGVMLSTPAQAHWYEHDQMERLSSLVCPSSDRPNHINVRYFYDGSERIPSRIESKSPRAYDHDTGGATAFRTETLIPAKEGYLEISIVVDDVPQGDIPSVITPNDPDTFRCNLQTRRCTTPQGKEMWLKKVVQRTAKVVGEFCVALYQNEAASPLYERLCELSREQSIYSPTSGK